MEIRSYDGDREALRPLFREADDSDQAIESYLASGEILIAVEAGSIVGYGQLISDAGAAELKSMAVVEHRRSAGIGQALVQAMLRRCREGAVKRLVVATAAADTGNIRFYQRQGFRLRRVERDAFGPESGYPAGLLVDGILLRDRVWLDQDL
jgi:GNAT superfamily N-acetyltransferase